MIHKLQINIPTLQEIKDLKYPIASFMERKLIGLDSWIFKKGGIKTWKLMYRLTKRCGSVMDSHYPIIGNGKSWIWETVTIKDKDNKRCVVCSDKYILSNKGFKSYKNYSTMGRKEDMASLRQMEATATNDAERTAVKHAMHKLKFEDKSKKSMRESLIKATREHDHDKIKEIHDTVGSDRKYQNE